jgi:hypothetical protein
VAAAHGAAEYAVADRHAAMEKKATRNSAKRPREDDAAVTLKVADNVPDVKVDAVIALPLALSPLRQQVADDLAGHCNKNLRRPREEKGTLWISCDVCKRTILLWWFRSARKKAQQDVCYPCYLDRSERHLTPLYFMGAVPPPALSDLSGMSSVEPPVHEEFPRLILVEQSAGLVTHPRDIKQGRGDNEAALSLKPARSSGYIPTIDRPILRR